MARHHILVPTDFSVYAEEALQQALALARRDNAPILLVHVLPPCDVLWAEVLSPTGHEMEQQRHAAAAQRLQALAADQPVPIETLVISGDPVVEICRLATAYRVELIVMSTHGSTGLASLFIGSVAERVVRQAPCSVLVVRRPPSAVPLAVASP